ncbi:CoA-binding protein [Erysipelothrix urinaevulpis]|uniref:CoA-binding protein n=1 Tax=Erysipelothrix urinaevulpis TaxID=2683717 RepID=UPI00135A905C|nr:CoA-binding protein [Erysipelothrix urinaevulpis]
MKPYDILTQSKSFAVVGMNPDPDKYAYKIYQLLKEKGKTVYGLNPKYDEIEHERIYKDLDDLNKDLDVVVFVVNPKIGIHMLASIKERGIKHLWMQPGTMDEALIAKADELGLELIDACVLAVYAINEPK